MSSTTRNWLLLFVTVAVVLTADQITKRWIVTNLAPGDFRQPIPALSRYFAITHSANTGSAFGFLPQAGDVFLVIAVIVVSAMVYYYPRLPDASTALRIGIGLICGGALGNALDRLQYGHVIDFIHYQLPGVISNVSNLADHAILLGVALVLIESWRQEQREARASAASTAAESAASPDQPTASAEPDPADPGPENHP